MSRRRHRRKGRIRMKREEVFRYAGPSSPVLTISGVTVAGPHERLILFVAAEGGPSFALGLPTFLGANAGIGSQRLWFSGNYSGAQAFAWDPIGPGTGDIALNLGNPVRGCLVLLTRWTGLRIEGPDPLYPGDGYGLGGETAGTGTEVDLNPLQPSVYDRGFFWGALLTEGDPAQAPGTWLDQLSNGVRFGVDVGGFPMTVSETYRTFEDGKKIRSMRKTQIGSSLWQGNFIEIPLATKPSEVRAFGEFTRSEVFARTGVTLPEGPRP